MKKSPKKIVVVCGYPKSGTTWSTRLVAQLLNAPSLGYWGYQGKTFVTEGEERKSDLVCYQSHHPHDKLLGDENAIYKVVYVVRDPRDIVVSGIFHFNFYSKWLERLISKSVLPTKIISVLKRVNSTLHSKQYKISRMFRMLNKGDQFIDHCHWAWNEHVSAYLDDSEALVIKYEDLLLDGINTARTVLDYCGVDKSDELIAQDLQSQSFDSKKSEFIAQGDPLKINHMRKGVVGDWKTHLSSQDESVIKANQGEVMKMLGYL